MKIFFKVLVRFCEKTKGKNMYLLVLIGAWTKISLTPQDSEIFSTSHLHANSACSQQWYLERACPAWLSSVPSSTPAAAQSPRRPPGRSFWTKRPEETPPAPPWTTSSDVLLRTRTKEVEDKQQGACYWRTRVRHCFIFYFCAVWGRCRTWQEGHVLLPGCKCPKFWESAWTASESKKEKKKKLVFVSVFLQQPRLKERLFGPQSQQKQHVCQQELQR